MRSLRFSVCVLIWCGLLQSFPIAARPSQEPVRADAQAKSSEPAQNPETGRVVLHDGLVSFVPPAGFAPMPAEVIAVKFPDAKGPAVVYGNKETTVSIAITFPPQRVLSPEQLPEFKTFMESLIAKQKKDLKWLQKELVEINGRSWIHFEFTCAAIDTTIHNHMYITSLDERMLAFNFHATVGDYEKYQDALEKSKDSIQTGKK
jgi:hypothetical protein